jgi:flagellin
MKVNYNMSAIITNNQLLRTENKLSAAMERLSSGFKLNHAKDDAAGMAISNKMQLQIDGLDQASQNASNGASVLQTADGALDEVTSLLQRMRELAVQAANDTNTLDERTSIQEEIDSLREEVDRVSKDTEFNSKTLLDGSLDNRVYGKNVTRLSASAYVDSGMYNLTVDAPAEKCTMTAGNAAFTDMTAEIGVEGVLSINGALIEISAKDTYEDVYAKIRDGAEVGEAEANITANGELSITTAKYGSNAQIEVAVSNEDLATALGLDTKEPIMIGGQLTAGAAVGPATNAIGETGSVVVNGVAVEIDAADTYEDVIEKINEALEDKEIQVEMAAGGEISFLPVKKENDETLRLDVSVAFSSDDLAAAFGFSSKAPTVLSGVDAELTLGNGFGASATVSADGNRIVISDKSGFEFSFLINEGFPAAGGDGDLEFEVTEIGAMTLQIGANQYQTMDIRLPKLDAEMLYLDQVDVTTVRGGDKAIVELDKSLDKLLSVRAQIGAYENRLDYAVASLDQTSENMTAALARIKDTDMAAEMSEFTQQNVLEQAAISVLTQANDLPQQTLQLLQ